MRVIAGKAKRLQLKTPTGMDTRPTTDRIKETLFNMIQDDIYDVNFLDLFSGSGGIGIEALSRGARHACFVEQSRNAAGIIRDNLRYTKLDGQADVMVCTALSAITMLQGREKFHVVFMDPPYGKGLEKEILRHPSFCDLLKENALVIVEADLETFLEDADLVGFHLVKEKIYKTNKHIFLEKL
ncbi:MAG: 16S rRNA (guanine(966)-N(2))-methyltransferase RsmD [Lachnospiraceae bacterium]|nr:16S rRNA (guanine(966)-N(2))-methyltransferase RsmD [Lachnospiraceae bacterium]